MESQEQIVALMRREGVRVNQASVSRDIREMGLVKLAGRYLPADRALTEKPGRLRPWTWSWG